MAISPRNYRNFRPGHPGREGAVGIPGKWMSKGARQTAAEITSAVHLSVKHDMGGEADSIRSGRVPSCSLCWAARPGMGSDEESQARKWQSQFYFQEHQIIVQGGEKVDGRKIWPWTRTSIVAFYWKYICIYMCNIDVCNLGILFQRTIASWLIC